MVSYPDQQPSHFTQRLTRNDHDIVIALDSDEFIPPVSRWVTLGGFIILGAIGTAVGLAAGTPFPVTVRATASVRPDGEVKIIQVPMEGTIRKIEIKENQRVKQGQIIARIDDSRMSTRKSQLESSIQQGKIQIQQLDAQKINLNSQIAAEQHLMARSTASAQAELIRIERDRTDKQSIAVGEVQEAQANIALAKAEFEAFERAGKEGAVAQIQVEAKRQAYLASQARLGRFKAALNPTTATVSIAQEQIGQAQARGEATLANLQREEQTLLQQQSQLQAQISKDQRELKQVIDELQDTVIRSQTNGTILKLGLRNKGQVVRPSRLRLK
jgi:multidrug efflux pump subunit AcrA (membrane-fusion protein)